MEIVSIAKSVRISPRKMRLVADMIRHMSISNALRALEATPKRAALPLEKALKSAIANAVNNSGIEEKSLAIDSIIINQGQSLKRFIPSTRGRIHPYKKRSSHIKIVLKTKDSNLMVKKTEVPKEPGIKSQAKDAKKGEKAK